MPTRRKFLASLLAVSALPTMTWADAGNPAFLAAAQEIDGSFALFGLNSAGEDLFRIPLPARGHAGAAHPLRPEAVTFARRPGTYALVLACAAGQVIDELRAAPGRSFAGHGAFSADGETLFTVETVEASSAGEIGVWRVASASYRRIAAFSTGGIGPHEIRLMPDGAGLVVANGGIRTAPNGREKLNIATMAPNLTYLTLDGDIRQQISLAPELHHASIRHLALWADGLLAFAMQWEGPPDQTPPLLGLHRYGQVTPVLACAPLAAHRAMLGYAGSVAVNGAGTAVAMSSPRGGRVQVFDANGQFLHEILRADVCGLAASGAGFALTDGFGTFAVAESDLIQAHRRTERSWDNHIVQL
jgi:hypothetical protein